MTNVVPFRKKPRKPLNKISISASGVDVDIDTNDKELIAEFICTLKETKIELLRRILLLNAEKTPSSR